MKDITLVTLTILLSFALHRNGVLSVSNNADYAADEGEKGEERKLLWFGPRIGRKKRNSSEDMFKNLDRDDLERLMETIKGNPWISSAFNNDKRYTVSYTPRLGRNSGEETLGGQYPLIPRTGRQLMRLNSSPRLVKRGNIEYFRRIPLAVTDPFATLITTPCNGLDYISNIPLPLMRKS
ncbi:hypothetical protein NQ317_006536 [Molorchus minor]|uniref:Uncharacterized protein n=1 Tax=Molorchus minor TaxID=1323400 RepID=A0ABQ9J935_9CUCU|nr:hypothetical protein NQ317_006536 [Molorchus minor]